MVDLWISREYSPRSGVRTSTRGFLLRRFVSNICFFAYSGLSIIIAASIIICFGSCLAYTKPKFCTGWVY